MMGKTNTSQSSIIILLVYLGKLPWYFPLFLHSCRLNPSVDFFLLLDDTTTINYPPNVKIETITEDQLVTTINRKLCLNIDRLEGCKVCDFKPAFAHLFPELIGNYGFWGYSDMDLIFGNLRSFLTDEILKQYDVMSFRPEYMTGPFAIYRNEEHVNSLFLQSNNYEQAFLAKEYANFEECNFLFIPLQHGEPIEKLFSPIDSMTHTVMRKAKTGIIRAHFDFNLLEGPVGNIRWDANRITYRSKFEVILFHFLTCKNDYSLCPSIEPLSISDVIYFTDKTYHKAAQKRNLM